LAQLLSVKTAFLGCKQDDTNSTAFSFVHHNTERVLAIKEKERISNSYCCGVYGFASKVQFQKVALQVLTTLREKELYMSDLFSLLIEQGEFVAHVPFPGCFHIGSLKEVQMSLKHMTVRPMRICFDLDNTLVTYPRIPGNYATVEPVESMVALCRKLKSEGHTIIIYTARRMLTHNCNVGRVMKDIGAVTFETLDRFGIEYDEIIFGKPIADIYIDDRAVNPYRSDMLSMGLFQFEQKEHIINQLPPNKHNSISLVDGRIVKTGPSHLLRGQAFFYKNIPNSLTCFPLCYSTTEQDGTVKLELEYLRGVPLFHLLKHGLFSTVHMDYLFHLLDLIHNAVTDIEMPAIGDIAEDYLEKFQKRLSNAEIYPFTNREDVLQAFNKKLKEYVQSDRLTRVPVIHGDFWLSNMILTFKQGKIKCFDMKGSVGSRFCLGGDPLYDYAKLYQSILGYDCVLWDCTYPETYKNTLLAHFATRVTDKLPDIEILSKVLMLGTLHAVSQVSTRTRIWQWLTA